MTTETAEKAITEYNVTTAALAKLKKELTGKKYDVTTTAGLDLAKLDRRGLVTLRTTLEAKRKEIKAPALAHCNLIDAEAKRITAEITALEKPIDDLIKAEEAKKEEERAEKARIAAEAQKVLDDKIIEIGKLPLKCIGMDSGQVTVFLSTLEARPFGAEFTNGTLERAEAAKAEAVLAIREMLTATIKAEEIAAEAKAEEEKQAAIREEQRIESERLAEIEQKRIEEQQAELAEQKRINDLEAARLKKLAEDEEARIAATRQKEQEAADKLRKEQEAIAAEQKRVQDETDAAEREKERLAAIESEKKRVEAVAKEKAAEKARKLAEAKCADSATAFKKIIEICTSAPADALAQIALIAEGNL